RLDRVVNGRREEPRQADDEEDRDDPVSREGFVGMLNNRRNQPAQPPGVSTDAPHATAIRGRLLGPVRPQWSDPAVEESLAEQDDWYKWQSRRIWHRHWKDHETRW